MEFFRTLLSRRDWVYLLGLLVPFVVYSLILKTYDVVSRSADHGLFRTLNLVWSDVFFNLGYVLLWIGLFAVVRGRLRWVVIALFHVTTMLVVIVATCAHQFFQETGTTLDYGSIVELIAKPEEVVPVLLGSVPLLAWVLLAVALFYAILGPWLLTRAIERWRGWPEKSSTGTVETSFLGSLGLWLLAVGFGSLSVLIGTTALARDPFVNLVLTGAQGALAEEDGSNAGQVAEHPAAGAGLVWTPWTEKRNVVLIHLESTRERSVTPYNEDLQTTPFLNELAESGLLVERAYVGGVPRSSMASVAVNCGIQPPLKVGPEYEPGGVPAQCLATLLREQDYSTVFFSSNTDGFVDAAIQNFGYEEFFAPPGANIPPEYWAESMDTKSFKETSYFGYEDDIMLKPSEEWLKEHKDEPFLAQYFTGTGHDDYRCLDTRYGSEDFSEDDLIDSYLNCLRLQDIFLKNLFDQYKELGLYEETIFVLYGDHGEGFGEHGRFLHGDTPYEEGVRIPLIVHAPGWFEDGERVEGPASQIDILPTVLEMLGYWVKGGEYPGYSLLHPLPEARPLRFSCISERKCLASIEGYEKYIYHFGNQPDEFFDLSDDPFEEHDLAGERVEGEMAERREELLEWRSKVNAEYGGG